MAKRPSYLPSSTKGSLSTYEPSLKDQISYYLKDILGEPSTRNALGTTLDYVPVVGDAITFDEAKRDYDAGNYGSAALNAGLGAVGSIPGVGDAAAAGLKAAAPMLAKAGSSALSIFLGPGARAADFPGVTLSSKPNKLLELLHGSRSPIIFDSPKGGIKDVGLHLSNDPAITDYYAGIRMLTDDIAPLGGRTYPVIADPGAKPFTEELGMIDPILWNNPKEVADQVEGHIGKKYMEPELRTLYNEWRKGMPVDESLKKHGWTSMEYSHGLEMEPRADPGTAWLFPDSGQVVPKYSPAGILAAKHNPVTPRPPSALNPQEDYEEFIDIRDRFNDPMTLQKLRKSGGLDDLDLNESERAKKYMQNMGLKF